MTSLTLTAMYNNKKCLAQLLSHGAEVNKKDHVRI